MSTLQIGRYRILHRIASGGMADVYRAVATGDGGFKKEVVLKRINAALARDDRAGRMFLDEARLAVGLMHPNIVQVLDVGRISNEAQEEYFLVLESVRGRDLWQILESHDRERSLLPFDIALYVALEVARALDYAHTARGADGQPLGIVHRDVSAQNVLVSFEGEVKLTDFGIAKVLTATPGQVTEPGTLKGKIAYMSPEQAAGHEVD